MSVIFTKKGAFLSISAMPLVRFRLSGEGIGVAQTIHEYGTPHVIETDAHPKFGGKDSAPSPLAYALAALTSCTQVTSQIVANDHELTLGRFKIELDARLDPTVLATGVEGVSNFTDVLLTVAIETDASPEAFQYFGAEVERRCPVTQLFRRSGVKVSTTWTATAPQAALAAE
jgi:putative redox protein